MDPIVRSPDHAPAASCSSLWARSGSESGRRDSNPRHISLGTAGLPVESPEFLATFHASRVRLHTGLYKPAHDGDSRPRARPATFAHGRDGPALAPTPGLRQPAARRANVARRGRLRVYAYRFRDDAAGGGDSVDVDTPRPRRYSAGGDTLQLQGFQIRLARSPAILRSIQRSNRSP